MMHNGDETAWRYRVDFHPDGKQDAVYIERYPFKPQDAQWQRGMKLLLGKTNKTVCLVPKYYTPKKHEAFLALFTPCEICDQDYDPTEQEVVVA